jgi:hypothetical protein
VIYREAVVEARREALLWRIAPPRQRRYTRPGCGLGALLQRLTIDATTEAELGMRLDAARAGFAAEGLTFVLPSDPAALGVLGPQILSRLRRIGCPTSAAALLLAVATDARAGRVASCTVQSVSPDAKQVQLLPGTYRIPADATPLLRAALIEHQARGLPGYALLTAHDGGLLLAQAMANLSPGRQHCRAPLLDRAQRLRPRGTVRRRTRQQRQRADRRRRASPTCGATVERQCFGAATACRFSCGCAG